MYEAGALDMHLSFNKVAIVSLDITTKKFRNL